jgi:DNA-directed RNA polymerase subunit RPC12/RpoP
MVNLKCPRCGKKFSKEEIRKNKGKCNNCGFLFFNLTRFSSPRSRLKSKYIK